MGTHNYYLKEENFSLLNKVIIKMDEILKRIKKNRKVSSLQNKKDYYQLREYQQLRGKVQGISKDVRWAANRTYKYYDGVNFEGPTPRQLTKMRAENFDLIVKGRQLSRGRPCWKIPLSKWKYHVTKRIGSILLKRS